MSLHEKLKSLLLEAGLSEPEVLIYLELLKSPGHSKWDFVNRTGLDRNKVYRVFDKLRSLKLVEEDGGLIKPLSLKALVSDLYSSSRKKGKLATRIKNIAPYLRMANESVDEFEVLYTKDQFLETYSMMAQLNYDACLDFGDLESFVPILGGMDPVHKFRTQRAKHANNIAICTTTGPYTQTMAKQDYLSKFKATLDFLNFKCDNRWVIFSDDSDYVMLNDMSDKDYPCSVLMKSRSMADLQRTFFKQFSQMIEN